MATAGNDNAVNNRMFSRFLDLPPELRIQIYDLCLPQPILRGKPIPIVPNDPLLQVCKQIRQEILPIHEANVRNNLLVEPCQHWKTDVPCDPQCQSVLVRGDHLITTLGRANVATLPHIGKMFLSPARVAELFTGENEEDDTIWRVEVLVGVAELLAVDLRGQFWIDREEAHWQAMVTVLTGMGLTLSAVRHWEEGWCCDDSEDELWYTRPRRRWQEATWYVQYE